MWANPKTYRARLSIHVVFHAFFTDGEVFSKKLLQTIALMLVRNYGLEVRGRLDS